MLLKPVCVKCQCFYRPEKNGFRFTEGMPIGPVSGDWARGVRMPGLWKPYKLWVGDLWKCPDCGHEIVVGVVGGPVAEHYMGEFEEVRTKLGFDRFIVNDC